MFFSKSLENCCCFCSESSNNIKPLLCVVSNSILPTWTATKHLAITEKYEGEMQFAALYFGGKQIEFRAPKDDSSLCFVLGNYDDVDASSKTLKP